MKISVVIPNYNHANFLPRRIESVLNQTFQDFEIIILDDLSIDKSRNVIETYRSNLKVSQIVYNEINSGSPFKQWEKGIKLAKGNYIWIAESDDFCESTFLETAIGFLTKEKSSIFFCQSYSVDERDVVGSDYIGWTEDLNGIDWNQTFTINGKDFIVKGLKFKNVIPNASAVVFKNSKFDFKDIIKYRTCGDWFFWINILAKSTISYSPEKLNYFRSHSSTTRNINTKSKYAQRIIEELAVKHEIYKLKLIDKKEFNQCLSFTTIKLIPNFSIYRKVCNQLGLPNIFLLEFLIKKIRLKIKRIIHSWIL